MSKMVKTGREFKIPKLDHYIYLDYFVPGGDKWWGSTVNKQLTIFCVIDKGFEKSYKNISANDLPEATLCEYSFTDKTHHQEVKELLGDKALVHIAHAAIMLHEEVFNYGRIGDIQIDTNFFIPDISNEPQLADFNVPVVGGWYPKMHEIAEKEHDEDWAYFKPSKNKIDYFWAYK